MRLKVTHLEIEGDGETLARALSMLDAIAHRSAIELSPAAEEPAALPSPQPSEQPQPVAPACCGDPLPAKPRPRKPRKPKDDPPKPRAAKPEPSGSIRVDTGRSKKQETLDALREHGPCSAGRLAGIIGGGVSSGAVYQRLLSLMADGSIRAGDERGTFEAIDE